MADPHSPAEMRFGKIDDIKSRIASAIDASRQYHFSIQDRDEGYEDEQDLLDHRGNISSF